MKELLFSSRRLMMRIGLIGAGAIGKFLLEKINSEKKLPGFEITTVFDERAKAKTALAEAEEKYNISLVQQLDAFLSAPVDIVVECANIAAVEKYAPTILKQKDMLIISIGALVEEAFLQNLKQVAEAAKTNIYLPAGAVGGLDVLRAAASLDELDEVSLTTRKPAKALSDTEITSEQILFTGEEREAIKQFPKNANVAIILSLAGIGVKDTRVTIIADPAVTKNIHFIEASGAFGKLELKLENNPSPTNPKTSYLTALSIFTVLEKLDQTVQIG